MHTSFSYTLHIHQLANVTKNPTKNWTFTPINITHIYKVSYSNSLYFSRNKKMQNLTVLKVKICQNFVLFLLRLKCNEFEEKISHVHAILFKLSVYFL